VLDHGALERLKNDAALSQLIGDYIAMNQLIAGKDQASGDFIECARLIENLGTVVVGHRSAELERVIALHPRHRVGDLEGLLGDDVLAEVAEVLDVRAVTATDQRDAVVPVDSAGAADSKRGVLILSESHRQEAVVEIREAEAQLIDQIRSEDVRFTEAARVTDVVRRSGAEACLIPRDTAGIAERIVPMTPAEEQLIGAADRLIDAAVELCDRQGFERTTVDQIAAIADVSPRTFSRYFPTKDAIALALIDDALDMAAVELARQPSDIGHFEALRRSYVTMYNNTKSAPPGALSADRMMCTVRIIMTSPSLRQAALEYRPHAVNVELAKRLGVDLENRRLKLLAAIWGSIIMTAMADLSEQGVDWGRVWIDDIVARLEATFAEFMGEIRDVRQRV